MAEQAVVEQIRRSAGIGAIGFGAVAVAAPRVITSVYGLTDNPNVRVLTRLWGTRTAALGAIALAAERPQDRRAVMKLAFVLNTADTVLAVTAGPQVSWRARVLGGLSSAAFAAALGYALSKGE